MTIKLTKKGFIVKGPGWNDKYKPVVSVDLFRYLDETVVVDSKVTIKDFLTTMASSAGRAGMTGSIYGLRFAEFVKDMGGKPDKSQKLDIIECYWHADVHDYEGVKHFSMYPSSHGICKNDKTHYAYEFTPVCNYRNALIKLNHDLIIYEFGRKTKPSPKYHKEFTLHDFLKAILNEIGFFYTPGDRDEKFVEITGRRDEVMKLHEDKTA